MLDTPPFYYRSRLSDLRSWARFCSPLRNSSKYFLTELGDLAWMHAPAWLMSRRPAFAADLRSIEDVPVVSAVEDDEPLLPIVTQPGVDKAAGSRH